MSMYLSVSSFKIQDGKLGADYTTLSREVNITEFLDSLLSEKYISFFSVFEEDEELEYREVSKEHISDLSEEIDTLSDDLFVELRDALGKLKKEEIISKIRDTNLINQLIKLFFISDGLDVSSNTKVIIS